MNEASSTATPYTPHNEKQKIEREIAENTIRAATAQRFRDGKSIYPKITDETNIPPADDQVEPWEDKDLAPNYFLKSGREDQAFVSNYFYPFLSARDTSLPTYPVAQRQPRTPPRVPRQPVLQQTPTDQLRDEGPRAGGGDVWWDDGDEIITIHRDGRRTRRRRGRYDINSILF